MRNEVEYEVMNQGRIIEYIDRGSFVCTLCMQDKGNRLHLLTSSNREVNLSPKRALLVSAASIDTLSPRESLLDRLKQIEALRDRLKKEVEVRELWDLIRDEDESFDYKCLAELCFGDAVTDDHISALVRALFENKLYFRMKDGRFLPNSEERVDEIIRQREEEALKEEKLRLGSTWLKDVFKDRSVEPPPCEKEIIDLLIELALYGDEAPNLKDGRELLLRAGIPDIQQTRSLLIRLGIWEEDENIELLRLDLRTSFNEEQLQESAQLGGVEIGTTECEDLRDFAAMTIDGPLTRDFDDALSIEIVDDMIQLGIHIADVAQVMLPDSILDKEASLRGSSLYLPRRQIPMLPPSLSQDTLSLKEGCDRRAISLISRFDSGGNLLDYRFVPSLIKVHRQLSYDHVNEIYRQDKLLEQMYRLTQLMRQKRLEQGALILSLPEVAVKIDPSSAITLELIDQETPSRIIVAELMIFYNWLTARFCKDNRIPVLYRCQQEPGERISVDEADYVYFVFKQRRKLNPLMINTEPKPHAGLGLDVYTQASSPIRRYLDLVVQRQIRNFLLNRPTLYNKEELEKIRMAVEPVLKDLGRAKRNRTRYWIQKYLLQHIGENFSALILYAMKKSYRILLTDFLLVAEMKREGGMDFSEGDHILVKVKKADPWNALLKLEYARR
jgi:exoribonuclease-2